jgi:hypothetical protein
MRTGRAFYAQSTKGGDIEETQNLCSSKPHSSPRQETPGRRYAGHCRRWMGRLKRGLSKDVLRLCAPDAPFTRNQLKVGTLKRHKICVLSLRSRNVHPCGQASSHWQVPVTLSVAIPYQFPPDRVCGVPACENCDHPRCLRALAQVLPRWRKTRGFAVCPSTSKDRLRSPESSSTSGGPGREREGIVDGRSSHMDW